MSLGGLHRNDSIQQIDMWTLCVFDPASGSANLAQGEIAALPKLRRLRSLFYAHS